jgi:polyketide cyclase/dehydrase/lipid transport protein
MLNRLCHIALFILATGFGLGPALAVDYTTVDLDISVERPAADVWKKIGGYCDISAWMKVSCVYTKGTGGVGTVRRLIDKVDEVMVGQTSHSYTYTDPTTTYLYHGTLNVEPDGPKRSKIIYTPFYDQDSPDAKAFPREQRIKIFTGALASMKALAEAK